MPRGMVGGSQGPPVTAKDIHAMVNAGHRSTRIHIAATSAEARAAYPAICEIIQSSRDDYSVNLQIRKHLFQLRAAYFAAKPHTYLHIIPRDLRDLITRNMQRAHQSKTRSYTFMLGLPWSRGNSPSFCEEYVQMTTMHWEPNLPGDRPLHLRVMGGGIYAGRYADIDLHITANTCNDDVCNEYTEHKYMSAAEIAQLVEDLRCGRVAPPRI